MSDTIQPLPPVPDGIREAAQRGILVPFIGAGVLLLTLLAESGQKQEAIKCAEMARGITEPSILRAALDGR